MSHSVDKLKELLFQPESDAIAALSSRIEAVFERAGSSDRFQASVAKVLDGALRDAEVARHDEVASAIAPLIVNTVKTEITNSTDELVEALYPETGRMVKAYVASAIKDLTNEINRKLEQNPVMLRLNALLTGRSAAELLLADSQRLKVEDVFLIRRATGELVARWPEGQAGSNLDHVMGGVLTTINEFTSEAFKAEGSALRQIDLGGARVYLRVSPAYLLAAKCSGTAPPGAEQAFDEEFLGVVSKHHAVLDAGAATGAAPSRTSPLLQSLAARLETRVTGLQPAHDSLRRGVRPLTLLGVLIGLPLAGLLAWNIYVDYRLGHVERVARATLSSVPEMQGYPNVLKASERGNVLTVSGLAPTLPVKSAAIDRLKQALPAVAINDELTAVPVQTADVGPLLNELKEDQRAFQAKVASEVARQNQDRASRLIGRTATLLAAAASATPPAPAISALAEEAAAIASALTNQAAEADRALVPQRLHRLTAAIKAASLTGLELRPDGPPREDTAQAMDIVDAANRLSNAAETFVELSAVKRRLDEESARLQAAIAAIPKPEQSPRERLERFAKANAIFFNENAAFRDEAAAAGILNEVVRLMQDGNLFLRVVGYTDDQGTPAKNLTIAKARAETVAAALIARGVPAARVVALNRTSPETNVSPVNGVGSANRRVEFEVGFNGESGR